ncbi:MAG TPA: ABC transporter substrate-binding protein [Bacillota bacterium]|nr:ABC transporter substrate-binding protein [Bacillota bacterium]
MENSANRLTRRRRHGAAAGLAAAALLLLTACGGAGGAATSTSGAASGGAASASGSAASGSAASASAPAQKVTITFVNAMASGANAKALAALIKDFEAKYPNITVNNIAETNYGTEDTKLQAMLAAHQPPDIAQMYNTDGDNFKKVNAIVPVQQFIDGPDGLSASDLADFYPQMLATGKWPDGTIWLMPFNKSTEVLYYNTDMFKAAGIDHPPATWDEMAADAKALSKNGVIAWQDAFDMSTFEAFIKQLGGSTLNAGETQPNFQDTGLQVLNFWVGLVKQGYAKQDAVNFGYETDFGNQKSAFTMASIASLPFMIQAAGSKFTVGVAPLPANKAQAAQLYGTDLGIFKTNATQEAAAWTFVKFATSTAENEAWVKGTGYLPIRKSVTDDLTSQGYFNTPEGKDKMVAINFIPNTFPDDFAGWWDQAAWLNGSPVPAQIQAALIGQETPQTAIQTAFKRAQQIAAGGQ